MSEMKSSWVNMKPEEVETKVVELAKKGIPAQRIGLILRDEHGIPKAKLLGLKIKKILIKAKLWTDPETTSLKNKIEGLEKHAAKNKHDYSALRSLSKHSAKRAKIERKR